MLATFISLKHVFKVSKSNPIAVILTYLMPLYNTMTLFMLQYMTVVYRDVPILLAKLLE